MNKATKILFSCSLLFFLPTLLHAQSLGDSIYSLHAELENLYDQMIPLCAQLIGVGQAIAGFAALSYIAVRVWRHIARAEAVDFFPLLRPFAIGLVILFFPAFLNMMNGVLKPITNATAAMGKNSQNAIVWHMKQEEKAATQTPPGSPSGVAGNSNWQKYEQPDKSDNGGLISKAFSFLDFKNTIKQFISETIEMFYEAAGLAIDTIRTFYLIILAILGPIVLGLSVFDGFQQTLTSWISRYIHVYMWLPVANIFGAISSKILENMMNMDQDFFSSTVYIIFMIISIIGYTTVPNVAGYIVQAGGRDTLLHKVNDFTKQAAKAVVAAVV